MYIDMERVGSIVQALHLALLQERACPKCLGFVDEFAVCEECLHDSMPLIDDYHSKLRQGRCASCGASLAVCEACGASWCLDHQPNPLVCPCCGRRPSDVYNE
jgi:hypothetical protein